MRIALNLRRFRRLPPAAPGTPAPAGRVSVIIPARDEAAALPAAAASWLAQDWPDLEILLVDDRSSDGTGNVMRAIAERDPRVRVVTIDTLPDGWLGKVHALRAAADVATGGWLLMTDADVHVAPDAVRRAAAFAAAEGLGHLTVFPRFAGGTAMLKAAIAAFALTFFLVFDARRLGRPNSGVALGVGAFNLVRRDALAASPGFEWLRLEVIDDVGLGQMLNASGVKGGVAGGADVAWLEWYADLPGMVRGLEKNAFAAHEFSLVTACAGSALLVLLAGGLAAGAIAGGMPGWVALAGWVLFTVPAAGALMALGGAPGWALVIVPGFLINGWISLRSAVRCTLRGSIEWRGTRYPLSELRRQRRVRFRF